MRRTLKWFSRWELLFLIGVTVFWVLDTPAGMLIFLLLPILWLGKYYRTGRFFPVSQLDLPITLLAGIVLISLGVTPDLEESAGKVLGVVLGIAIYYSLLSTGEEKATVSELIGPEITGMDPLLILPAAAGAGVAFLGLFGADWFSKIPLLTALAKKLPDFIPPLPGAESGFQPNAISGTLTLFTPFSVWLVFREPILRKRGKNGIDPLISRAVRWFLWISLILQILWWVMAQTRGAWLGLAAGFLFLFILRWNLRLHWQAWLFPLVPVLMIYALWFLAENDPGFFLSGFLFEGDQLINTLEFRIQVWRWSLETIKDFFFTGMGMNIFRSAAPLLYPGPDLGDIAHAHNIWLDAAVSLGCGGLIIYLTVWLKNAALLWKLWKQEANSSRGGLSLALLSGFYAWLIFGMADTIPLGSKLGLSLWLFLGVSQYLGINQDERDLS